MKELRHNLPNPLANTKLFSTILPAVGEWFHDRANNTNNVLIVSTPDVQLSLKRIREFRSDYVMILHDDKTCRLSKEKLESMDNGKALVIPCDKVETILSELDHGSATTTAVLLTSESIEDVEKVTVSMSISSSVKTAKEDIRWMDLSRNAQQNILQQQVAFQNQVVQLKEIKEILAPSEIAGQFMIDVLNGIMCPELVKNCVPPSPIHYIPRKISSRANLSPEIFQSPGSDILVVQGTDLHQLINLTRKKNGEVGPVGRSSGQRENLTTQFIQLECLEHFEDICSLTQNPVHLISHKRGELTWRQSHRSLGVIPKFIRSTQNYTESEDNFVKRCLAPGSLPPSPLYYIPKNTSGGVKIDEEIFQNAGDNVLVVEGIGLDQLSNLAKSPVAKSSLQRKKLTAQFIQLEYAKHFENICELSENPVHWISYNSSGDEFTWGKSHGSLGCIQKYIVGPGEYAVDEKCMMENRLESSSPIIIADRSGMGKTWLMRRIAEKVQSESAPGNCVVRFLTLRDLFPDMQNQPEIELDNAIELIAKDSSDYDLGKQVVIKALKSEKVRCHVFLDGYDELLTKNQIKCANQFLECLKRQLKNTQIYVSTRPNKCEELEEALVTLAYRIKPFEEEDEVELLTGYWHEAGTGADDQKQGRIQEFAKSCLSRLKKTNMTEAERREIAGIPLQCRLLAEVHNENAKIMFTNRRRDALAEEETSAATSLFEMFKTFIDLSFGRVQEATVAERVRVVHMYHAIKLLFPEIEQEFKTTFIIEDNLIPHDSMLLAPGILEKPEDENYPRYIHRSLAEYIVAQCVIEYVQTTTTTTNPQEKSVVSTILHKILSTNKREDMLLKEARHSDNLQVSIQSQEFEHPVICYFLNSFMGEKSRAICTTLETVISPQELPNILTAAVASNFPAIASFITSLSDFNTDKLPWANLFLLAAKYGGTALLCQLTTLAKQKEIDISDINYPHAKPTTLGQFTITPLHVAVHWGNYNVALDLLKNNYGFHDLLLLQENHSKNSYLLHACVMGSVEDDEKVVQDKIQIIKLLCSEEEEGKQHPNPYRHVLEEKLPPSGATPLLQYRVHPKLIQTMIQVGADINAVNDNHQCLLHTVLDGYNSIQFHELVDSLAETTFKHYDLQGGDHHVSTPLHQAIHNLDIELRTVDLFLRKGADINSVDSEGESILFKVSCSGRSKEYVDGLAVRGAELIRETSNETTTYLEMENTMEAAESASDDDNSSSKDFSDSEE